MTPSIWRVMCLSRASPAIIALRIGWLGAPSLSHLLARSCPPF